MKEKILELRKEGKTYNQIVELLGCSKSTVSYHCGEGQKEKNKKRCNKRRENILLAKVERFKYRQNNDTEIPIKEDKNKKDVVESIRKFQKRDNSAKGRVDKNVETSFNWEDVLNKFSENTVCYLSGEKINLYENNYQLDHIIPASKNGNNNLDNLGILHKIVNRMKSDLTPEELIEWCIKILKYNGYEIIHK